MIEKLNYDFSDLFNLDSKRTTYDGIIEIYGKLNEVIDAVNIIGVEIATANIETATELIKVNGFRGEMTGPGEFVPHDRELDKIGGL